MSSDEQTSGFLVRTYSEGDEIVIGDILIIYKPKNQLAIKAPKWLKIQVFKKKGKAFK